LKDPIDFLGLPANFVVFKRPILYLVVLWKTINEIFCPSSWVLGCRNKPYCFFTIPNHQLRLFFCATVMRDDIHKMRKNETPGKA